MLEFKIIQELKPNEELLEIIKNYNCTIKNGKIKHLMATNLQFIEPTEYLITHPITLDLGQVFRHIFLRIFINYSSFAGGVAVNIKENL